MNMAHTLFFTCYQLFFCDNKSNRKRVSVRIRNRKRKNKRNRKTGSESHAVLTVLQAPSQDKGGAKWREGVAFRPGGTLSVTADAVPAPPERAPRHPLSLRQLPQRGRQGLLPSGGNQAPRCQMSALYSAIVRSEENRPALAMFTRQRRLQSRGLAA